MIEPGGANGHSLNLPFFAARDFPKRPHGGHRRNRHRKIWASELRLENLPETVGSERRRLKAIKVKAVLRLEKRMEKRNTLNVIPVKVRHQDVRFHAAGVRLDDLISQHANAGPTIENEACAAGCD